MAGLSTAMGELAAAALARARRGVPVARPVGSIPGAPLKLPEPGPPPSTRILERAARPMPSTPVGVTSGALTVPDGPGPPPASPVPPATDPRAIRIWEGAGVPIPAESGLTLAGTLPTVVTTLVTPAALPRPTVGMSLLPPKPGKPAAGEPPPLARRSWPGASDDSAPIDAIWAGPGSPTLAIGRAHV